MKLNSSICIGILLILGLVIIYILIKSNNIEKFTGDTVVENSSPFDPDMISAADVPSVTTPPDVPSVTTPPLVPSLTTPPVVPSITTPPIVPSLTTPPVVPSLTTPPVVPSLTTPPVVPSVTTPPIVPSVITVPEPNVTNAPYQNNTINSNSPTVTTAPPPGFHTQSINDMSKMGLYTLGKSNITQVGGEGPNNYFQPNIFIKRKPTLSPQQQTSNNTIISSNSNTTANMASISQYWTDYSYGVEGGYNFAQPENTTTDPISTAEQNARANYQREQELNGSCRNCIPAQYDFEMFGNNTSSVQVPGQFTHSCQMKEFVPGYQIQPPKCWDVPAKIPPVCLGNNERLPSAVFDRGTPLNALNLDTAVGSIMPKFKYAEESRT